MLFVIDGIGRQKQGSIYDGCLFPENWWTRIFVTDPTSERIGDDAFVENRKLHGFEFLMGS